MRDLTASSGDHLRGDIEANRLRSKRLQRSDDPARSTREVKVLHVVVLARHIPNDMGKVSPIQIPDEAIVPIWVVDVFVIVRGYPVSFV